jgi:hypothetical protein
MVSVPPIKMVILGWPFQVPKLELPTIRKVYVRANSGTTIFFQIVASFFVCNLFLDSHVFSFFTNLSDWHFQHQFGRKFVVRFGSKTVSASAGK